MNVKEIINNAKTAKLLKDNPTARQVAEIIVNGALEATINGLTDRIEATINELKTKSLKGDEGYTPIKGVDYFTSQEIEAIKEAVRPIKGRDYGDGEKPSRSELEDIIKPLIPELPEIDTATIASDASKMALEALKPQIPILDTPEQIADKLNTLTEKVDIKVIKGLRDELTNLRRSIKDKQGGQIGGGGSIVEAEDLSSQCDGANKTFTVGYSMKKVISLTCSQFPIILRRNVDYTFTDKTITLTSEVSAPESGQTLDISYTR